MAISPFGLSQVDTDGELNDEDFIAIVASERRQSIGFENDSLLVSERERALNYYKGEMPDLPAQLAGRSKAVSTDISDAIDTLLPDLIEIFLGGDDIVTFVPISEQDEPQAEQETDYVRQVVFDENDGFLCLFSFFKDALQSKTGILKFWWEDEPIEPEMFTGKTLMEAQLASQDGDILDIAQGGVDDQGQPLFNFTLVREEPKGNVKIMPVPPEDFTVARDCIDLKTTTYCAIRTRPRAQELIAQGHPREIVNELPQYGTTTDQTVMLARDTAGEHLEMQFAVGEHEMRQVEVVEHYVRVDGDGTGKPQLWRVLCGGTDSVLIKREKVDRIPFAAITPFIVTHRFYGESIADRLIEIQRIKTALTRMFLDSGYFALNQRMEVGEQGSNEFTISDLLRNEPNMPVRSKTGTAVRPLAGPGLSFNPTEALEYFSVQGEQRTGVYRSAQGLNPDSLHDTATGAMALLSAAQKRIRMIARVFAETGVKDMYLGVHALLRKHASADTVKRIRGQWIPANPSEWAERTQVAVQIGLGSAGKPEEVANMNQILLLQEKIVQMQGGPNGPLVNMTDAYNAIMRLLAKMGEKAPEKFFSNPAQSPPQQPKPNPEMAKVQADQQLSGQKLSLQAHIEAANDERATNELQVKAAVEQSKARVSALQVQMDAEERSARLKMEQERAERDEQFRYAKLAQDRELAMAEMAERRQLEMAKLHTGFGQAVTVQSMKDGVDRQQMQTDLTVQSAETADSERMADND